MDGSVYRDVKPEDAEAVNLLLAAQRGDRRALESLARLEGRRLYAVAYRICSDSAVEEAATVFFDDRFPIGPWIASTAGSKWIGPGVDHSPEGIYILKAVVDIPLGVDASKLSILGKGACDNVCNDIRINGRSARCSFEGYQVWTELPEDSGLGLFLNGTNTIEVVVENGYWSYSNPVGLRLEACIGFSDLTIQANAGPDLSLPICGPVLLDGGLSAPAGASFEYRWSLVSSPTFSRAVLLDPEEPAAVLVTDRPGTYVAELAVSYFGIEGAPDRVTVVVESCPRFKRGDATGDGVTNIADPIALLEYLFRGENVPLCLDALDATDDGEIDITDGILVLYFLFVGTEMPGPPFQECGLDPVEDDLSCVSYTPCG